MANGPEPDLLKMRNPWSVIWTSHTFYTLCQIGMKRKTKANAGAVDCAGRAAARPSRRTACLALRVARLERERALACITPGAMLQGVPTAHGPLQLTLEPVCPSCSSTLRCSFCCCLVRTSQGQRRSVPTPGRPLSTRDPSLHPHHPQAIPVRAAASAPPRSFPCRASGQVRRYIPS